MSNSSFRHVAALRCVDSCTRHPGGSRPALGRYTAQRATVVGVESQSQNAPYILTVHRIAGGRPMSDDLELTGRRALVTGGTQGIGQALVSRSREAGVRVLITARTAPADLAAAELFVAADVATAEPGVCPNSTVARNYPGSCSQREPKRPKGDAVRSSNLRGVVCGAWAPVSIWKGLMVTGRTAAFPSGHHCEVFVDRFGC